MNAPRADLIPNPVGPFPPLPQPLQEVPIPQPQPVPQPGLEPLQDPRQRAGFAVARLRAQVRPGARRERRRPASPAARTTGLR